MLGWLGRRHAEMDLRVCADEVDCGSNPSEAGVKSALRFCIIESSIAPRERRRKSATLVSQSFALDKSIHTT